MVHVDDSDVDDSIELPIVNYKQLGGYSFLSATIRRF